MVLLVGRLSKFYSKLENHHHHHHDHHHHNQEEMLSASLEAFRSDVSSRLNQIISSSKTSGSEILSLGLIHRCFELLPFVNKAFARLVVDIDYPMRRWEAASMEEYLGYSLNLLELLNMISHSLSHIGKSRLSLSHALSLVDESPSSALKHLKPIQLERLILSKELFKEQENKEAAEDKFCSGEERVIHEALSDLKSVGYWVCGVSLASLSGDAKPYLEIKKLAISPLVGLDSSVSDALEKNGLLNEIKELNDAVASLESAIVSRTSSSEAAKDLERRLNVFEKLLDALGEEVDHLFSKVLAGRNELLDGVRNHKQ